MHGLAGNVGESWEDVGDYKSGSTKWRFIWREPLSFAFWIIIEEISVE